MNVPALQGTKQSSSPFSSAPGLSFLFFGLKTILGNDGFFLDGDGPDIPQHTKKQRAWECRVMEASGPWIQQIKRVQSGSWMG